MKKDGKDEPEANDDGAASVMMPGPKRLAKWFAAVGYDVEIKLTRNGELSDDAPDPDADPGPINDPISADDLADIRGLLAAYDLQDKEPSGERGTVGPPAKDEPPPSSK